MTEETLVQHHIPEPSAAAHIGDLNHKKARVKISDPYSGGVSLGRNALPDAQSAAQNTEVCVHTAAAASGALPLSQPQKCGPTRVSTASQAPSLQSVKQRPMHAATPSQLPGLNMYTPSSNSPVWHPAPGTLTPTMFAHAPYQYYTPYPAYLPYYYVPPSQPR